MSFFVNPVLLPPPQPLEPPLFSGDRKYETVLSNRWTTVLSRGSSTRRVYSNPPAEMLSGPGIRLPAISSKVHLLPPSDHGISRMDPHVLQTPQPGSSSYNGQAHEHPTSPRGSNDGNRGTSAQITEPTFAALLTAGSDMKTVLESMDQELLPQDILDILRVDLARPAMPEEPVPNPDYKPRPSTVTGRAPIDARHSKKETERRAQHKHYLDLSELKIPDFFLKLCGWDEPRESGSKRTPRTKSSVLQAGCLYMWFLSGPVLRCFKSLLHKNHRLEEQVQKLEKENHRLLVRCESLKSEAQIKVEHREASGGDSTHQSSSLTMTGSPCASSSLATSLNCFPISEEPGFSGKHDTQLCPLFECLTKAQLKSGKRKSPSILSRGDINPASPLKKRNTNRDFDDKQDAAGKLTFDDDDDIKSSSPDIAAVTDQNKDDVTPTQIYCLTLSSAPSLQSATPSCWDNASVVSTSSSWDQPSPHSITDS